ncbi:Severin [Porphyridium purpureum]|uniref:Severin n=1 Tax=Porphyridium purpureum TaxID=35688 RepID=A0A5J4YYQ2_PORPP|nr:Severin [Porphyridium purpureum]|eukprot:POR1089..scf209_3
MGFFDKLKDVAKEALKESGGGGGGASTGTRAGGGKTSDMEMLAGLVGNIMKTWGSTGPADTPKWQNTNIGQVGSDRDKELRKAAAESEAEFTGAGEEPGLEIWRVEKFKPVRQPKNTYGKFFTGDSYVVLHTYVNPGEAKHRYDLFYWQGAESTQDEKGSSAYFTVNLDDLLNCEAVQYREVEGSESDNFLALFNGNFAVQSGGVGAGWQEGGVPFTGTPDKTTYSGDSNDMIGARIPKQLVCVSDESGELQLSVVDEGTTVSKSKLHDSDPFVLIVGTPPKAEAVYVWMGARVSPQERLFCTDAIDCFLEQLGVDKHCSVTFVKEGKEPPQWKAYVV